MKNMLVTGGAGFIGSNFIYHALKQDKELQIVNLDLLTYAGTLKNLQNLTDPTRHSFIEGDIRDRDLMGQILRDHRIDTIVHFAAESHVDRSILGPEQFIQTNVVGTFNLLEMAREYWIDESNLPLSLTRFHHISTDEVYGSLKPNDPPFSETTSYAPNSPYAASKASSDHLVRSYHHTYGLPTTITNCSNNYGPYQFPEKLIPLMILNGIQGKPLPIYGDGKQIRDWLYVEDHCHAIWMVLQRGRIGETYNVGGNNQPTNLEIVENICSVMDDKFPNSENYPHKNLIEHVEDRPGHDRRYAMNIKKIKTKLDWEPSLSLEEGLKNTVEWYLEHPEWVSEIVENDEYENWLNENYQKRGDIE